jgi:Tfp pilus assembly protein PilX
MSTLKTKPPQSGAALIVGLVMLVVISMLATSSTQTAISELLMARNHQTHELAFQAAEFGLEQMLAAASFDTTGPVSRTTAIDARTSVHVLVNFVGQTSVPDDATGTDARAEYSAYHFVGTATAAVQRDPGGGSSHDVSTTHKQSFYVVGPVSIVPSIPAVSFPVRTAWHVEGIR